ncbi:serine hydrolase [Methylocystis sp. JAN1]|uniref:serine hydrolase n=1 Tax=Methylocystis sp. JAN1 TaxID=3397211 RepID=UPI003FA30CD1
MAITRRSTILSATLALAAPGGVRARPRGPAGDLVEKHLPHLDRIVVEIMKKTGAPGMAIAVVSQDRVVYLKGFGVRRAGRPEPVDADTVFALASLSKPLATTVVAGVVGDGVVSWDDKIVRYLPDFAMSDPWITQETTLRDMFCHRSGLPDHAGDLLEDIGYGRDEVLRRLRYVKPTGAFRASYAYTNFGFAAAAVAAAKAAGKSWEDLAVERLYRPLGMTSASSRYVDLAARQNRAFGHVRRNGAWVVGEQRQPDAQSPAGGASSSARDMAAWLRLQLARGRFGGREVVKNFALDETHRPQIATGPAISTGAAPTFYGLGWNISYNEHPLAHWSHSGAFALGAATCVNILPARQLGVVALSNASPVGAPEAVCRSFLDLATVGKIERDWLALFGAGFAKMGEPTYGRDADYARSPPGAAPPAAFPEYVGSYADDLYGPISITQDVNRLTVLMGPKNAPYEMHHYAGDVFTFQPPGENAFGPCPMRFMRDGSHKITGLRIDCFDETGQGVFRRER